eukprot:1161743-Ditylum_brightwellii.AAC.1
MFSRSESDQLQYHRPLLPGSSPIGSRRQLTRPNALIQQRYAGEHAGSRAVVRGIAARTYIVAARCTRAHHFPSSNTSGAP